MAGSRKGQSTLEYIIIFTVIVGVVLLAANTFIRTRMEDMLNHTSNETLKAVKHVNFTF